jgi:hypothetical protein
VVEERLHAVRAVGHVEVEGLLAELLGEDQRVDVDLVVAVSLETAQEGEQKGEARQALLAVDDEGFAALLGDDDGAEVVTGILGDVLAGVTGLVEVQELGRQVGDQLGDLLGLPFVFALVVLDFRGRLGSCRGGGAGQGVVAENVWVGLTCANGHKLGGDEGTT